MIDVLWWTDRPGIRNRGYADQGLLEEVIFAGCDLNHIYDPSEAQGGAIVVLPARWYVEAVGAIQGVLERMDWALVVLCGDEEASFPWRDLEGPRRLIWAQTPYPDRHEGIARKLETGYWAGSRQILAERTRPDTGAPNTWFYAGQVNNPDRAACVKVLADRLNAGSYDGDLVTTRLFGSGLSREQYMVSLAHAKAAPCPPGSFTPCTFRVFEALEAGVVPITLAHDYWPYLLDQTPPWPMIGGWDELNGAIDAAVGDWPAAANRTWAFWQGRKRAMRSWLADDLARLDVEIGEPEALTFIVPTSPIASHPSTEIIEATIASIRARSDAEIIVCIDGVRAEQEHYRERYEEYQRRLLWLCNFAWGRVLPLRFDTHHHQAAMVRAALDHVRTPAVCFVEHDTPLEGDVPLEPAARAVLTDEIDMLRFYPEVAIPEEHGYLMVDGPHELHGLPLQRTKQWSARPHVASLAYYRRIIADYFTDSDRAMVEDRLHSFAQSAPDAHRIFIYHPEGSLKRSGHLDGRGDDPKWVD